MALDRALDQALAALALAVSEADARIEREALPMVMADPQQMVRLLQNLLSNALKFRRPGTAPHVRVSGRRDDGVVTVTVSDDGIGLPADGRQRLFALFRRLTTAYPGDGVGLAVCKRILDRHGGTIEVESEPGLGATFQFTLPAA